MDLLQSDIGEGQPIPVVILYHPVGAVGPATFHICSTGRVRGRFSLFANLRDRKDFFSILSYRSYWRKQIICSTTFPSLHRCYHREILMSCPSHLHFETSVPRSVHSTSRGTKHWVRPMNHLTAEAYSTAACCARGK